ncbi:MAG: PD-(D/E)XK nuclease domain-containing protein, partial [Desulfovibrionaceae bacterium]|nr:PD-(D/E)XK nuclease domain-containing protein [Desulfovibrionaceae bacterium]
NYAPDTCKKSGRREDIIVTGPTMAHAAVIEVKYSKTEKSMSGDAERALRQIKKTKYVTAVKKCEKVMLWGISFCQKACVARAEEFLKATAVQ